MTHAEMQAVHEPTRAELFTRLQQAERAVKQALTAEQYALVGRPVGCTTRIGSAPCSGGYPAPWTAPWIAIRPGRG
jgi:hypothetical protein